MVTIKDGCGCDPCDCDWKQKLKEAYSRATQSVNKIGDNNGSVYFPDGTGFVKLPLPTKEQIDSIEEIDGIKASVDSLNVTVPALEAQVTGVTESLVSDVKVLNGITAGKFKVRIEREKAALIDSNDYDLSKVNSIELIQGSGPAMVKAQLTLSDGTVLRSDDFLFTTESIGTDVYISSFTFKAGNVDGTISADIGLNNGTTLEANNFVVPTDPSVVSTITDLQTRTQALEQNVIDINNKADLDNVNQVIVAKQIEVNDKVRFKTTAGEGNTFSLVGGSPTNPFSVLQEKELLGVKGDYPIGAVAMLDTSGNPMNFTAGDGEWTLRAETLNNFISWVYGSSTNTYKVTEDLMIRVVKIQDSYASINDLFIKKCELSIPIDVSIVNVLGLTGNYGSDNTIVLRIFSSSTNHTLTVGGTAGIQITTGNEVPSTNGAYYWIYTKS